GNETRNPPRRGHAPIKYGSVACAQVAKKPNHKSGCVNRPAEPFGIQQLTPPWFPNVAATSRCGERRESSLRFHDCQPRWMEGTFLKFLFCRLIAGLRFFNPSRGHMCCRDAPLFLDGNHSRFLAIKSIRSARWRLRIAATCTSDQSWPRGLLM